MSHIRINSIKIRNYRSFGNEVQEFFFSREEYKKPVAIVGYNNCGKTNLMNAIKYGLCESVREDTFELNDFHNCKWVNSPEIILKFESSGLNDDKLRDGVEYRNTVLLEVENDSIISVTDGCNASSFNNKEFSKKWVIKQNAPIFYINFHNIKEEISTKKTSWGNLKSFLAKHIKSLVDSDDIMKERKEIFKSEVAQATQDVLEGKVDPANPPSKSKLKLFIESIHKNYSTNLRNNDCEVEFGLPDYEDIFLQMMFKIGLNGDKDNLIPIDHFGDGFISMFVMAVIQAIAESNVEDKCLFLFEEPESFLHENHQEYFYKTVLCCLTEKGHQVIYSTHSDRMVDIFDTKSLIRLEFDEEKQQTVKKFNNISESLPGLDLGDSEEVLTLANYNAFIKSIEPNLNKILFSKKVVLVEGPNDLMVYKEAVKRKVLDSIEDDSNIVNKARHAETYLNFHNIAIVPHHGKITALLLIKLCEFVGVDYFVINDWDQPTDFVAELSALDTEQDLKDYGLYKSVEPKHKSVITTNWKLLKAAKPAQIHFNIPKLETVIGYNSNNKSSVGIWSKLQAMRLEDFDTTLFPENLTTFLEINNLIREEAITRELVDDFEDDLPF